MKPSAIQPPFLQGSAVTYGVVVVVVVVVVVLGESWSWSSWWGWACCSSAESSGCRSEPGARVVLVVVVLVVVGIVVVVGVDTVGLPALVEVDAGGVAVACGVARGTEAGGTEARVVGDENGDDEEDDEDEGDEKGDASTLRAAGTAAAERAVRRALLAPALSLCARVAADDERSGPLPARPHPHELRSESLVCSGMHAWECSPRQQRTRRGWQPSPPQVQSAATVGTRCGVNSAPSMRRPRCLDRSSRR